MTQPPKGGSSIGKEMCIEFEGPVASYAGQLRESGLFELHEKVTLKLKVIDKLQDVYANTDICVGQELTGVINSLLIDLGIACEDAEKNMLFKRRLTP